jgi:hypothetical protein
MRLRLILFALLPLLAVGPAAGARSATPQAAVDLQLTDRPHAVRTDAGVRLIYELHLANSGDELLRLHQLEATDGDGRVLATFTGEQLERRLAPAPSAGGKPGPALPARGRAVLYLEWTAPAACPRVLAHVLTYAAGADAEASVRGGRTTVSCEAGAPLGPPLRGGPWIAIHYAGWPNGHRRVFTTVEGKARIPGRFAIDWVRVDAVGHLAHGDPDIPAHALGYGADVLAVADATVASVRDGMPEAARISANPHHALQDEAGNYVALRLDDGRYAFYEHLRPGSVAVKPGERVQRGDVLGALGFTGASTGPHLHFHVADGPSTIGEEGRPFLLEGFDLLGRYAGPATLGKAAWSPRRKGEAMHRSGEWPPENAVVRFPE